MVMTDLIQQTLERLQSFDKRDNNDDDDDDEAYTILVQSTTAATVRQALTETHTEQQGSLYRQAGLRTPTENAYLDWFGATAWWKRVAQQVAALSSSSPKTRLVVYLQTLPRRAPLVVVDADAADKQNVQVLDLTVDPWGWDAFEKQQEGMTKLGLSSLRDIVNAVQAKVASFLSANSNNNNNDTLRVTVVVDSLAPIWMRHGTNLVLSFVKRLQRLNRVSTLVLQTTDCIPTQLHQALEDSAHALLSIRHGQALWMYQGVRERDNVIRKNLEFYLDESNDEKVHGGIHLVDRHESSQTMDTTNDSANHDTSLLAHRDVTTAPTTTTARGRGRVQLKLEEDAKGPTTTTATTVEEKAPSTADGPRIFMQDDDPEFDDYDEEDPDDDLDI